MTASDWAKLEVGAKDLRARFTGVCLQLRTIISTLNHRHQFYGCIALAVELHYRLSYLCLLEDALALLILRSGGIGDLAVY